MATETIQRTDAKAGFCTNCRRGDHGLCASPTCTCPDARRHRGRPGYGAVIDQPASRPPPVDRHAPATNGTKPAKVPPVVELVAEEPPEPEVKLSVVDQVMKAIEDGLPVGNQWFRVVVMPSSRAAKALATKLAKHEVTGRMKLEWRAGDVKVFVRGPA